MPTKQCSDCKHDRDWDEFPRRFRDQPKSETNIGTSCSTCRTLYRKGYRAGYYAGLQRIVDAISDEVGAAERTIAGAS